MGKVIRRRAGEIQNLNELHLFAGAGGGILGGMLLGHTTVCAVEINPYCRKVMLQRQRDGILPKFPIWDDVRTFDARAWKGRIDVVCGGFPCQRFSTAAAGNNTAEDLWPEMLRVVIESGADFVFAENVSNRAIEIAAEDLLELGYSAKSIALSAADLGADHLRERYWLFAHANHKGKLCSRINAEMAERQSLCVGIWSSPTLEPGISNGMANRVDRFRAIGNGQVPIVAATAWEALA